MCNNGEVILKYGRYSTNFFLTHGKNRSTDMPVICGFVRASIRTSPHLSARLSVHFLLHRLRSHLYRFCRSMLHVAFLFTPNCQFFLSGHNFTVFQNAFVHDMSLSSDVQAVLNKLCMTFFQIVPQNYIF